MKFKIASKKIQNKFIYGKLSENKQADTLVVFMSGFSGGLNFPLFKNASAEFYKHGFSALEFNFCNDSEHKKPKNDTLSLEDMSFVVYAAEIRNILDSFGKRYPKIVLVGHSFGSVLAILFLNKYKKYAKNIRLVLWEPTLLPWKKKWMEEDFVFDKDKKVYKGKYTKEVINTLFYNQCIRAKDTAEILHSLNRSACIVSAQGSADKDARHLFSKIRQKKFSLLSVVEKTNHLFDGKNAQKELFKITINFLKQVPQFHK